MQEDNNQLTFTNSILYGPGNQNITSSYCDNSSITVQNSLIKEGQDAINISGNTVLNWNEGNIDTNPLWTDFGDYPYSLSSSSPCINAGTPDTTGLNLPEYDLAGNPRIYQDVVDIGAYEWDGTVSSDDEIQEIGFQLNNSPNPFNPSTAIKFSIGNNSKIDLSIFNIKGQKIKTLAQNEFTKGSHSIIWSGDDEFGKTVSSGVYYYKLKVNNTTEVVKKCLLLK
jgi:hypothetical protein